MLRLRFLTALACVAALSACEKNAVQSITTPVSGAFVRFHNYGVATPGVNFYANDQKLTAISNAVCTPPPTTPNPACTTTGVESTTGVVYGSVASGGNYAMVAPGQYKLSSRLASTTDNGLAVSSATTTLADGKFYSYFVSGIYSASAKTADAFVVEDALPTSFDYTKTYVRVVNTSSNSPSITVTAALQSGGGTVPIASAVAYKAASPFITTVPGLTDVTVTITGGTPVTFKGLNLVGGHVYSLALRGDATSNSSTTGLIVVATVNR